MKTLNFDLTIEDLMVFNAHIFRPLFVKLFLLCNLVISVLLVAVEIPTGEYYLSAIPLITVLWMSAIAISGMYYPQETAIFGSIFLAGILSVLLLFDTGDVYSVEQFLVALPLPALFVFFGLGQLQLIKYFCTGSDDIGPHTLTIDEKGLYEETPHAKNSSDWSLVSKVDQDSQNIYVFLARNKAYVVPKRIFADPSEMSTFLDEIIKLRGVR